MFHGASSTLRDTRCHSLSDWSGPEGKGAVVLHRAAVSLVATVGVDLQTSVASPSSGEPVAVLARPPNRPQVAGPGWGRGVGGVRAATLCGTLFLCFGLGTRRHWVPFPPS